jgi:hypothetical protein
MPEISDHESMPICTLNCFGVIHISFLFFLHQFPSHLFRFSIKVVCTFLLMLELNSFPLGREGFFSAVLDKFMGTENNTYFRRFEEYYLLGCEVIHLGEKSLMFRRNVLSPASGSNQTARSKEKRVPPKMETVIFPETPDCTVSHPLSEPQIRQHLVRTHNPDFIEMRTVFSQLEHNWHDFHITPLFYAVCLVIPWLVILILILWFLE